LRHERVVACAPSSSQSDDGDELGAIQKHKSPHPLLQGSSNIHGDHEFVFNKGDRALPESGVVYNRTSARLSANARMVFGGPQCPEPSINPKRPTIVMIDWQKAMSA
jgi:hypothetical protein